jgi:hypothetical protein
LNYIGNDLGFRQSRCGDKRGMYHSWQGRVVVCTIGKEAYQEGQKCGIKREATNVMGWPPVLRASCVVYDQDFP